MVTDEDGSICPFSYAAPILTSLIFSLSLLPSVLAVLKSRTLCSAGAVRCTIQATSAGRCASTEAVKWWRVATPRNPPEAGVSLHRARSGRVLGIILIIKREIEGRCIVRTRMRVEERK
jgi:hypothetical protein